jgi:hypothetical protein
MADHWVRSISPRRLMGHPIGTSDRNSAGPNFSVPTSETIGEPRKRCERQESMKNFGEFFSRGLNRVYLVLLPAATVLSMAACATTSTTSSQSPQLMFVQTAEDLKVDPAVKTLRLVRVSQQTLYFSDRPIRIARHFTMADYLKEWTARAGKDNFGANPPNAMLSVYEPGQPDNTLAVVEITQPRVDGADLIYSYKLIDGKLPAGGGATSLFIDWIGVGGGVGVGYHGVGVGLRGPGLR